MVSRPADYAAWLCKPSTCTNYVIQMPQNCILQAHNFKLALLTYFQPENLMFIHTFTGN